MKLKYDVIYKVITEWDPMGIIFYKNPECTEVLNPDEYESEIDDIYDKCDYVKKGDVEGLAKTIADIFSKWFGMKWTASECFDVARKIYIESKMS